MPARRSATFTTAALRRAAFERLPPRRSSRWRCAGVRLRQSGRSNFWKATNIGSQGHADGLNRPLLFSLVEGLCSGNGCRYVMVPLRLIPPPEHDPEKGAAVFGKGHATTQSGMTIRRRKVIPASGRALASTVGQGGGDILRRAAGIALEGAQISVLEARMRLDRQEMRCPAASVARRSAELHSSRACFAQHDPHPLRFGILIAGGPLRSKISC